MYSGALLWQEACVSHPGKEGATLKPLSECLRLKLPRKPLSPESAREEVPTELQSLLLGLLDC